MPDIIRMLSPRAFAWEIEVTNLSLINDTETAQEVRLRFATGANSQRPENLKECEK